MPVATTLIIAGLGVALSAAGTAATVIGQNQTAQASQRSEDLRAQQLQLDTTRQTRQLLRQRQVAAAQTTATATSQGANGSDSSIAGAVGESTSSAAGSLNALNQNADLGRQTFAANADASRGQGIAGFGSALSGWGSSLVNNAATISKVGSSYGLWNADKGIA